MTLVAKHADEHRTVAKSLDLYAGFIRATLATGDEPGIAKVLAIVRRECPELFPN